MRRVTRLFICVDAFVVLSESADLFQNPGFELLLSSPRAPGPFGEHLARTAQRVDLLKTFRCTLERAVLKIRF